MRANSEYLVAHPRVARQHHNDLRARSLLISETRTGARAERHHRGVGQSVAAEAEASAAGHNNNS